MIEDFEEPDIKLDYFGGTSGTYSGFDRFGRVTNQKWVDYGSSNNAVWHQLTYDRVSNPTKLVDQLRNDWDEGFTFDGVSRLTYWDIKDPVVSED